ncbi:SGNH/GDSL hydrolase family protein [Pedobacter sp. SYSU D00535]|uniref:SGNH/GDSL hydrolase family protein n=1 Tax=Pedobacter sp. SYSU D00535 TaxID=2810308 RepID=UPI001A970E2B|nr:SGNH/GDSL hydrolase family protein [Pedobacter sp. SYSU D00535]
MRKFYSILFTFLVASLAAFGQTVRDLKKKNELTGEQLQPLGRYDQADGKLELIGSAVHFGVSFEGEQCQLLVSVHDWQNRNYIQYELDGVYQKRLTIKGGSTNTITIQALSKGKHTLWIYKATEAQTGPVFIHKLQAKNIKPLAIKKKPLIEFIGNSITCGAAADASEIPCGAGEYHDQHNAYQAYGPRTARALNVNYILSSVSGYGMYRNWNSEGPTLPQVYDKLDLQEQSTRPWNAAAYRPDIISIALGTNDLSGGDGKQSRAAFDSTAFINAYVKFVKKIRTSHPDAQILLLNNLPGGGDRGQLLQSCLESVKRQIDATHPTQKPLAIFLFEGRQMQGCTGHPSVADHDLMAKELLPFLTKLIK